MKLRLLRSMGPRRAVALATALAVAAGLAAEPTHAIDRATVRRVQPASVQLGPLFFVTDKATGKKQYGSFGWGSGTILSADGIILTNAHVTDLEKTKPDAAKAGATVVDGVLVVHMTKRTDEPPIPVFIAKVLEVDEALDIAVLKVAQDLQGKAFDPVTTPLPWVALGDSDELELGDTLNIFGYPGIGGRTITYTNGPVSGFDVDPAFKGRAWIKTSASISGGNSGGTGVDEAGLLVGIPTRGGTSSGLGIVDCRPAADTNGDGKLDGTDACVPTGGFINSLRTVNAAKVVLERAGVALGDGVNGDPEPAPPTTRPRRDPAPTTRPTRRATTLPPDTEPEPAPVTTRPRRASPPTTQPAARDSATVGIEGFLTDATTGKPVVGAWFGVLVPGKRYGEGQLKEEDFLATIKSDSRGFFANPRVRLTRGETYAIAISHDEYKFVIANEVEIPMESADILVVRVKMERL